MITAPELAKTVKELRDAQKAYFQSKNRDWKLLDQAKKLERKVDEMVNQVLTAQVPRSGSLF